MKWGRFFRVAVAVALAAGCSGGGGGGGGVDVETRVAELLGGFDGVNLYTLDLAGCNDLGSGAELPLGEALADPDPDVRWAAASCLGAWARNGNPVNETRAAEAIALLQGLFSDPDPSVQLRGAEMALALGDKSGFPAIIDVDLFGSGDPVHPSEPPMTVAAKTLAVLQFFSGETLASEPQWQSWWDANGDDLVWDEETERYQ